MSFFSRIFNKGRGSDTENASEETSASPAANPEDSDTMLRSTPPPPSSSLGSAMTPPPQAPVGTSPQSRAQGSVPPATGASFNKSEPKMPVLASLVASAQGGGSAGASSFASASSFAVRQGPGVMASSSSKVPARGPGSPRAPAAQPPASQTDASRSKEAPKNAAAPFALSGSGDARAPQQASEPTWPAHKGSLPQEKGGNLEGADTAISSPSNSASENTSSGAGAASNALSSPGPNAPPSFRPRISAESFPLGAVATPPAPPAVPVTTPVSVTDYTPLTAMRTRVLSSSTSPEPPGVSPLGLDVRSSHQAAEGLAAPAVAAPERTIPAIAHPPLFRPRIAVESLPFGKASSAGKSAAQSFEQQTTAHTTVPLRAPQGRVGTELSQRDETAVAQKNDLGREGTQPQPLPPPAARPTPRYETTPTPRYETTPGQSLGVTPAQPTTTVASSMRKSSPPTADNLEDLFADVDANFAALMREQDDTTTPSMLPPVQSDAPSKHHMALTEARELFAQLAANHMRQLRDFMLDVKWGEAPRDWLAICEPAVGSLRRAAEQLELSELCRALDDFGVGLAIASRSNGRVIEGKIRDQLMSSYSTLVYVMPQAFALDTERSQREAIIVHSLLLQVPEVGKVTIDKLFSAGLTTLDVLLLAKPDELALVTGIDKGIAGKIVAKFQNYRRDLQATSPDATRTPERAKLSALAAQLRTHHEHYEKVQQEGSTDGAAQKRQVRQARADTLLQANVVLARLGEVTLLHTLEKLPFEQKIEQLESYLKEAAEKFS